VSVLSECIERIESALSAVRETIAEHADRRVREQGGQVANTAERVSHGGGVEGIDSLKRVEHVAHAGGDCLHPLDHVDRSVDGHEETSFQVAGSGDATPDAVATTLEGSTDGDSSTRVGESAAPGFFSPGAALADGGAS